jgi:hypothetical protein
MSGAVQLVPGNTASPSSNYENNESIVCTNIKYKEAYKYIHVFIIVMALAYTIPGLSINNEVFLAKSTKDHYVIVSSQPKTSFEVFNIQEPQCSHWQEHRILLFLQPKTFHRGFQCLTFL